MSAGRPQGEGMTPEQDALHLRRAIELSYTAKAGANRPYGAVIALPDGTVLAEAWNRTGESRDCTTHAETDAIRAAVPVHAREVMARATMYASGEPCVMCAGAIFLAGIRRVVFGVDAATVREYRKVAPHLRDLELGCAEVLAASPHPIEVIGPLLVDEAVEPHRDFWKA
jgi:tRNA(Arg) A34 adenosine deaminase TadA